MDLSAVEIRVLGCLVEKQRTTPDVYPLSLNSLRLACNQSTNRDPVVDYDEPMIREALETLARQRWVRLASASRSTKYRHLLDEKLGLTVPQMSTLAVLMLRGPQTLGELRTRTERLHPFADQAELTGTLSELMERELAARIERRPGQKEERYIQLLSAEALETPDEPAAQVASVTIESDPLEERVEALERQLEELKEAVSSLSNRASPSSSGVSEVPKDEG